MIEIVNLTKKYGKFTALNQLNLSIDAGVVFGVVGANGAGKSTTFSILATLLAPSEGYAKVNGFHIINEPDKVRASIGYMPDFFGVYDHFTVEEYLHFYGASYHIPKKERLPLITQLLQLVNLEDKRYEYVDLLSRGMKQRLCLARCLIHDPQVLILDEPASGLDPRARVEMRDILKTLKSMGKTILISSHILPELAEMCDEIGIINKGQLVARGNVAEIQAKLTNEKEIVLKTLQTPSSVRAILEEIPGITKISLDEDEIHFAFNGTDEQRAAIVKTLINQDIDVIYFAEKVSNLEDVFMEITKEVNLS